MTLAQLEERVTILEKVVEQLQTRVNAESEPISSSSAEPREEIDADLIPGTEYDLVVTVPPHASFHFQAHIVSIQTPPAELGLSDADWALYGSEDEDETYLTAFATDIPLRLRLRSPYREHLAQAFARYFMRVGLPHDARAFENEGDVKP